MSFGSQCVGISKTSVGIRNTLVAWNELRKMRRALARTLSTSSEGVDAVIVGAGVVGLSIARSLALSGLEVIVIEKEGAFGTQISSRNSEVIHAGMHYSAGSLKAQACVEGKQMLYDYCKEKCVDHKRLGKLIVGSGKAQVEKLRRTQAAAVLNGVHDLEMITGAEAKALEPEIECTAALFSPSTGILDSHGLMTSILADAESCGANLAINTSFQSAMRQGKGFLITLQDSLSGEAYNISSKFLVNSAGISAQHVAGKIGDLPSSFIPPLYLAKGSYFSLVGKAPFKHLVYPTPVDGGLGVHLTVDLEGQAKFGPDVEWVKIEDFRVDAARERLFFDAIRSYYPGIVERSLHPAYASIRPKVVGPGEGKGDFIVHGKRDHGVQGLVNLFGIESPGLTSCLFLGEHVKKMLVS